MGSKKRKSPSEWQALVAAQRASGLSVAAFCLKHGLVDKTFYNQRNKLGYAPGPVGSPKPGFVQVSQPLLPWTLRRILWYCTTATAGWSWVPQWTLAGWLN